MATQFSTLLKVALPTQGELSGSWGNTVNENITKMVEEAIAGTATINTWSGNSATLSTANGTTAESRNAILNLTDTGTSLSGAATVIVPTLSKIFIVKNGTAQTVTVKTASGTGVAITAGETGFVYCDGTNVVESLNYVAGDFGVGGNLAVTGNATVTGTTTFNGGTITLGDANTDNIVFGGEVDSNIIPDDDNTYDLGSSSKQWKDIYINGSAYIDGLAEDILVATDKKVLFRDSALFINSSADGQLDIAADTEVEITTALLEISADATVGDDLTLKSDAAVLGFGADTDVTLTHVADTGVLLNSTRQLQFGDSGTYIHQSADGVLDLVSDTEIEINATTIDINGNVEISGDLTVSGDDITMGTNTAGNLLVADGTNFNSVAAGSLSEISTVANDDVFIAVDTSGGGLKKITRSTLVAGLATSSGISNIVEDSSPQLGGNLDMNGADIVTTSNATLDLAPNGTGTVVVRGNTNSGRIVFNCESNSHGQTLASQPHSAAVTNIMLLPAGGNSTLVSLISTDTLTNKTLTSPVINTGTFGTSILPVSADGTTLGSASKEFSDLFLADAGTIQFGNDQDVTLTHVADTGLLLNAAMVVQFRDSAINIGSPADGDLDINADDEIELNSTLIDINGNVEISGTAAITGIATFTDDIIIGDGKTIGSASDVDAITIASNGQLTLTQQLNGTAADFSGDVGGGNFQPDGDTAAGDAAAFGYTAALGAIITGQGSTNDITLVNDADATVLSIPTGTTNVDIVGVATAATFEPDGDTAAGDNAAIGYTAGEGLILTGQGSTTDVTIKNDADATVASIATGTTIFKINDDIEVDGRAFGHVTTDNDGSFDLAVGNDFQCTPSGDFTLTFTNPAAGQSGNVFLINSGGHTVSAHASVAINATALTALATAGTYHLAYYCSAASGNNTIAVSASGALT